jgi:hypothetical protein
MYKSGALLKKNEVLFFVILYLCIYIYVIVNNSSFILLTEKFNEVNSFLGPVGPLFSDWYNVLSYGGLDRPYENFITNYTPFSLFLAKAMNLLGGLALAPLLLSWLFLILYPVHVVNSSKIHKELQKRSFPYLNLALSVILILNYPLLFGISRGNFDVLAGVVLIASIFTPSKIYFVICTAVTISIKPWAIGVLFFLILRKRYKDATIISLIGIGITLASAYGIGYVNPLAGLADFFNLLLLGNVNLGSEAGREFTVSLETIAFQFLSLINAADGVEILVPYYIALGRRFVFIILFAILCLIVFKYIIRIGKSNQFPIGHIEKFQLLLVLLATCASIAPNYIYRLSWFVPTLICFAFARQESYLLPISGSPVGNHIKIPPQHKKSMSNSKNLVQLKTKSLLTVSLFGVGTPILQYLIPFKFGDGYSLAIFLYLSLIMFAAKLESKNYIS